MEFDLKKKTSGAGARGRTGKKLPGWLPDVANAPAGRKQGAAGPQRPDPQGGARPQGKHAGKHPGKPAPAPGRRPDDGRGAAKPGRMGGVKRQDPHGDREAQRYENPIPSREAILAFLAEQGQPMSNETLAEGLHLASQRDVDALGKRLGAMLRDGQLLQNRRGAWCIAQKLDLIPGTIIANAEGFGFLRADAGGDDIYISPVEMRKVLHGDRVLASVIGVDRRGRKQAAIAEVLERRTERLVGRVVIQNGVVVVAPDDRRLHQDVLITPGKERGARSGQIVVAEITQPPTSQRGPIGEVVSVLGERLTPSIIVEMAIAGHGLPHDWRPRL